MTSVASAPCAPSVDFAHASVLVVAPHPDDESLALGGLIQHALRQQARVTILQVTDGDNNPWPQRCLEHRWRIGPAERQRWGRRRAAEMLDAMHCLGLPATACCRLGWPDLGVGPHLASTGMAAVDRFVSVVQDVAPDIVVLPALNDHHPDHGASHVLMRLALARLQRRPVCLTYLVHGRGTSAGTPWTLELDAAMRETKHRAIMAHRTQVAMARRRLLAWAGPHEHLYRLPLIGPAWPDGAPSTVHLPWHPPRSLHPWLQLRVAHADGVHAWPWQEAPLRRDPHGWQLLVPNDMARAPAFAKLEMRCTSPWIFDHWGWCDLTALPRTGQADA